MNDKICFDTSPKKYIWFLLHFLIIQHSSVLYIHHHISLIYNIYNGIQQISYVTLYKTILFILTFDP